MKNPDSFKSFHRKPDQKKQGKQKPFHKKSKSASTPRRGKAGEKTEKPSWKKDNDVLSGSTTTTKDFPLNKYIAHCGVCSRRKAVDYIKAGDVIVNGKKILEPGFKVTPKDEVILNGKKLHLQQELVYILLNKPKDYLTTTKDPQGRHTVMELIRSATRERVYPVGRLDRNTSGLLLFTNDGELAQQLAHPSGKVRKVYHVTLDKPLTERDFNQILAGVELEDGVMTVDALAYADAKDKSEVGLEIHSGRNRIVRRTFEHLGYKVKGLDRVLYAGLTKKNIPRGKSRFLNEKEIRLLKHFRKR